MSELEHAWNWRESAGLFDATDVLRVFHGPGEGRGDLRNLTIDRFGTHYWLSLREKSFTGELKRTTLEFLRARSAQSAVASFHPESGTPMEAKAILGSPPPERFEVREGQARFLIQFHSAKQPGLFLDHALLRSWLQKYGRGLKVLNTFAYTGSLSVCAGLGGAEHVTTLDLSKPILEWAKQNWLLNRLPLEKSDWVFGDAMEWLARFAKSGRRFDCVILDPPSFSRTSSRTFSTARDLTELHSLALGLLPPGGVLVSSINSANISKDKFIRDVSAAAKDQKRDLKVLSEISLPESFPTRFDKPADRYLKGWIFRVDS